MNQETPLNSEDAILAAILLNRREPMAPHHAGWLREKLRYATDEELLEIVRTGNWPTPNVQSSSETKIEQPVMSLSEQLREHATAQKSVAWNDGARMLLAWAADAIDAANEAMKDSAMLRSAVPRD